MPHPPRPLDPNVYLNQAGTTWPKPDPVQCAVVDALRASTADWPATFETAQRRVAAFFGIADPARLLLTPGCTSALAVGIADHAWTRGERVIVSGLEHHALFRPVTLLRELGVEVSVIPRGSDTPLDLDVLERELEHGNVKLVALTAACNVTGELLPIADAVALAHAHDALCLIDGAQIAGWLPIDVAALGVDLFAFAGHKALHAPWGIGGLYVAPSVALASPAAVCELPTGSESVCAPMPGYCDVGSVDRAALAGLAAALDWLESPQLADRLAQARDLLETITAALQERSSVRLLGLRDPSLRLPTIAFTVADRSAAEVAGEMAQRGIIVGSGLQCAPLAHETLGTAPGGAVRLSMGPTNGTDDVERVLAAVRSL